MNILLLYASYSSGTQTAAEKVAQYLYSKENNITSIRITEEQPNPKELQAYDLVILASPSWMVDKKDGQPHTYMKNFLLETCKDIHLEGKKFAIFGLGDTTYAHFCGAVDVMEKFVHEHGGELVQPSLRIDSFYFNVEENTKILLEWVEKLLA